MSSVSSKNSKKDSSKKSHHVKTEKKSRSRAEHSDRSESSAKRTSTKNENTKNENTKNENTKNENAETYGFVFVYESNKELFIKIEDIEKSDGNEVVIHPVYYSGYNNTMNSEEIIWSVSKHKYVSRSDDGSWIDVLKDYPDNVFAHDKDYVIFHEGAYYCCESCLLQSILGVEPELVSVK